MMVVQLNAGEKDWWPFDNVLWQLEPWKDVEPRKLPKRFKPINPWRPRPLRDTITCPHCGCDTGIGNILLMVIYPPGLGCPSCGEIVVGPNAGTWM